MATENLLMAAVARGGDRQALHEVIRRHSLAATAEVKSGAAVNSLVARLQADPAFAGVDFTAQLDPTRYVGRAPQQIGEFLADVVAPIRAKYPALMNQQARTDV